MEARSIDLALWKVRGTIEARSKVSRISALSTLRKVRESLCCLPSSTLFVPLPALHFHLCKLFVPNWIIHNVFIIIIIII